MACGYSFEFDLAMIIQCLFFFYLLLGYQKKTGARKRRESEWRVSEVRMRCVGGEWKVSRVVKEQWKW